jgi:Transcription factor WhiB
VAVRADPTVATLPLANDDWRGKAACGDSEPGLFDYDPDTDPKAKATAAKQVCAGCQVRDTCRATALAQPADQDTIGIYGGLTPAGRAELRGHNLQQRAKHARESWRLGADPTFARVTHDLAAQIGVEAAARELGVNSRTLQRAWRRHQLGPHAPIPPPRPEAARWLVAGVLERLGWTERDTARYYPGEDPELPHPHSSWPARSACSVRPSSSAPAPPRCIGPGTATSSAAPSGHHAGPCSSSATAP